MHATIFLQKVSRGKMTVKITTRYVYFINLKIVWFIVTHLYFSHCSVRETHQIAEAQQEKNAKLREAFGISEFFVEGSSLDPERHAREAEARAAASKVYELVRTPSPEIDPAVGTAGGAGEQRTSSPEKKTKRKRSASSTKKKKGKKHKKDRYELA